eukprot:m.23985 g.23985  ORF g.23985 m.23985 type:complete len:293 (-) comp5603_c0_seq1:226-1104(-)
MFEAVVDFCGGSLLKAVGFGLGVSALYVGSIYLTNTTQNRNHPSAMKKRMAAVGGVTVLSPLLLYIFYGQPSSSSLSSAVDPSCSVSFWDAIFLTPSIKHHLVAAMKGLLLFATLFIGPILQDLSDGVWLAQFKYFYNHRTEFVRNFVVAPLTEEIVFRACVTAPLFFYLKEKSASGIQNNYLVALVGPLFFGVAHAHHYFEGIPLLHILFQIAYTTLFGFLSAMTMIYTNSIIAAIVAHSFCNWMGFPGFVQAHRHKYSFFIVPAYFIGLIVFLFTMFTKRGHAAITFHSS